MNDNDYIEMWLVCLFVLVGIVLLAMLFYFNANRIVDAAYNASTPVVKAME